MLLNHSLLCLLLLLLLAVSSQESPTVDLTKWLTIKFTEKKAFQRSSSCYTLIPKIQNLEITNNCKDNDTIEIKNISTESLHLHVLDFKIGDLKYADSMLVKLLYLPMKPDDNNKATVTIDCDKGKVDFTFQLYSTLNPYRVIPIVNLTMLAEQSASTSATSAITSKSYQALKSISLYNPHNDPLTINELFTVSSFLSLSSFPSGKSKVNANNDVKPLEEESEWTIPPYSTRKIITVTASSDTTGSFTGSVHVVTNRDSLVIPVEASTPLDTTITTPATPTPPLPPAIQDKAHTLKAPIINTMVYYWPLKLDFGLVQSNEQVKTLHIDIAHSGPGDLHILGVRTSFYDPSIEIRQELHEVPPTEIPGLSPDGYPSSPSSAPTPSPRLALTPPTEACPAPRDIDSDGHTCSNKVDVSRLSRDQLNSVYHPYRSRVATVRYRATTQFSGLRQGSIIVEAKLLSTSAHFIFSIPYEASLLLGGLGFAQNQTAVLFPRANVTRLAYRIGTEVDGDKDVGSSPVGDINLSKKKLPLCDPSVDYSRTQAQEAAYAVQSFTVGSEVLELSVINYYPTALRMMSATVQGCAPGTRPLVTVLSFDNETLIPGGQSFPPIRLARHVNEAKRVMQHLPDSLPTACWLEAGTEISTHKIPLTLTDGSLQLLSPSAVCISYISIDVHIL